MAETTENSPSGIQSTETKIDKLNKVKLKVKSQKVLGLLDLRAKDDDTALPKIPSAQMWNQMTVEEQDDLRTSVEDGGTNWYEYERQMRLHWPKEKPNRKPITYRSKHA